MDDTEVTITMTKFRQDLSAVLEAVLVGTTVRVERNRRPLAVLISPAKYDELTGETR